MAELPRYLMTPKDLAQYVSYVNHGASADSRNMFLQHFKHKPVEVTTCEECAYWLKGGLCMIFDESMNKDDFCSVAKRKGGENA